jgi:hypothetical protein
MPLFLGAARTRVKEEVTMSAPVARELRSYVDWASGLAMMPDDEVLVRTIDHALSEYFRNDKAWQRDRAELVGAASGPKTGPKAESPPTASTNSKPEPRPSSAVVSATGKGA